MVFKRIFSAWKRFDLLFRLSNDYKKHKRAQHILHSFNDEVMYAYNTKYINNINMVASFFIYVLGKSINTDHITVIYQW